MTQTTSPVADFFKRLAGAFGVGGLATLVDLGLLLVLVELLGLSPEAANVPALLGGAVVQFVGCRELVFRGGDKRSVRSTLAPFALVEAGTLLLNAFLFVALVKLLPVPYVLVRVLTTFVVFVGFSFPAWHWVFAPKRELR
ncbi:MAG: putative flippase GtrA [Polyangiales bacterium]|jgi:putative flippase GtrA